MSTIYGSSVIVRDRYTPNDTGGNRRPDDPTAFLRAEKNRLNPKDVEIIGIKDPVLEHKAYNASNA
jgi:hypothetical protein